MTHNVFGGTLNLAHNFHTGFWSQFSISRALVTKPNKMSEILTRAEHRQNLVWLGPLISEN